ncbi:MAG: DNA polymerase II [Cellvibrionaceae bacterium]
MNAFLLTRQWRDTVNGITLDFWFASENGPVNVEITGQEAVFFIRKSESQEIVRLLTSSTESSVANKSRQSSSQKKTVSGLRIARLKRKKIPSTQLRIGDNTFRNYKNEMVVPLYFKTYRLARDASQKLTEKNIPHWEVDIRPPERFLMERFITGGAEINSALAGTQKNTGSMPPIKSFSNPKLTPSEWRPVRHMSLKTISIDIETSMDASVLYSIALFGESIAAVFMVSVESSAGQGDVKDLELVLCRDARDCLERFVDRLQKEDPDILIGWNVVQFDFWVLEMLSKKHNIRLVLGRNLQTAHWREDSETNRRYLQIPGRIVLDGIELLRAAAYNFTSFSLENVAQELLDDGKLLKNNDRGSEITTLFHENKIQLAEYNIKDCELVWDIFEQESLLEFAIERSHLTGLPMDRMGGSVASFDYAYLPLLHRKGYIAPNLGEQESDIVSPGGYVMNSIPGIFKNVLVLDFKSLYPSIIRTFHIDPYSYWYVLHESPEDRNIIEGFNGASFSKTEFLLPGITKKLWDARDKAKSDNNAPLSQAIKIIMNSFYGVLGSTGCRFYDPSVCSSITLRGHEIIQKSKAWIEQSGYQVIYGDTDSVFVWVGDETSKELAEEIGRKLAEQLNQYWIDDLKKRFQIDSALEIEFETHYSQFLMPTIRNSKEGSKKRYAGVVDIQGQKHLVFKGLENVRTDWTILAKQFQESLYQKVFAGESVEDFVKNVVDDVLKGRRDRELVYRKRLRRKLDEYVKNIPPHIQAARKLLSWTDKQLKRGEWIEYVITTNGPEPVSCQRSHVNYDHYIEKQLQPVADGVLQFVDLSFADITASQLTLFGSSQV